MKTFFRILLTLLVSFSLKAQYSFDTPIVPTDTTISIGATLLRWDTLYIKYIPALHGTSKQAIVTQNGSAITISLPQDIDTTARPVFNGLTAHGLIKADSGKFGKTVFLLIDTTGTVKSGVWDAGTITVVDSINNSTFNSSVIIAPKKWIGTSSFASGWTGYGWQIAPDTSYVGGSGAASGYGATFDQLTVRGNMKIYELIIQQLRSNNGSVVISNNGTVDTIKSAYAGDSVRVKFDDRLSFVFNDLIEAQRFHQDTSGHAYVYQVKARVGVCNYTDSTCFIHFQSSSDSTAFRTYYKGMQFVRIGNTTRTDRQGLVYITADDDGAPFLDVKDGVSSFALFSDSTTTKARLGKLAGIRDISVGLTGQNSYGLYSNNVYLKGIIIALQGGKLGGTNGWYIRSGKITSIGGNNNYTGMNSDTAAGSRSFFAGANDTIGTGAHFYVTPKGYLYADSGKIATWDLQYNKLSSGSTRLESSASLKGLAVTKKLSDANSYDVLKAGDYTVSAVDANRLLYNISYPANHWDTSVIFNGYTGHWNTDLSTNTVTLNSGYGSLPYDAVVGNAIMKHSQSLLNHYVRIKILVHCNAYGGSGHNLGYSFHCLDSTYSNLNTITGTGINDTLDSGWQFVQTDTSLYVSFYTNDGSQYGSGYVTVLSFQYYDPQPFLDLNPFVFRVWDSGGNRELLYDSTGLNISGQLTIRGNLNVIGNSTVTGTAVLTPPGYDPIHWNQAYTDRLTWDGGSTNLNATTGRSSLGLGSMALADSTKYHGSTSINTVGTLSTGKISLAFDNGSLDTTRLLYKSTKQNPYSLFDSIQIGTSGATNGIRFQNDLGNPDILTNETGEASGNHIWTLPAETGVLATLENAHTWNGLQTFDSAKVSGNFYGPGTNWLQGTTYLGISNDINGIAYFYNGTSRYYSSLSPGATTFSANRTLTIPDVSGTLFTTNGGQTVSSGVWQGTSIDTTYTNAVSNVTAGTAVSVSTIAKTRKVTADTTFYSTTSKSGFLKYTDWNTFNNKQNAIANLADTSLYKKKTDSTNTTSGYTTLYQNGLKKDKTDSTNSTSGYTTLYQNGLKANKAITFSAGTAISSTGLGDLSANRTINADTTFYATTSKSGFIKYVDWNTFNNKIGSLNGLTAVTQTFAIDSTYNTWGINSATSTHTWRFPGTRLGFLDKNNTWTGTNLFSNTIGSSTYASRTTGWQTTSPGYGDFRYLYADELHARSFIADLEQTKAGSEIIVNSAAKIDSVDFTVPTAGNSATLIVEEYAGFTGQTFANNDTVQLRSFTRTSGNGLTIASAWGTVTYKYRNASNNPPTQAYTFLRLSGADSGSFTQAANPIKKGTLALDYGQNAGSYVETNNNDGTNSPYVQTVQFDSVAQVIRGLQKVQTRVGKLTGITSTDFGVLAGSGFYGENIFAEGNVNIAGTLTAGDSRGFSSSFYVGPNAKNLLKNSNNFLGTGWSGTWTSAPVLSTTLSPSLSEYAWTITTTNRNDGVWQTWSANSGSIVGTTFTFSVWLRGTAGQTISIQVRNSYGVGTSEGSINNVTFTGSWQRCSVSYTFTSPNSDTANGVQVLIRNYGVGTPATSFLAYGAQLELGATPTIYQPTDGTLSTSIGYGMWSISGGFGGTIQNPVVSLNDYGLSILNAGHTSALTNNAIMIGNITGQANSAIKLTNTGTNSTSGLFGYNASGKTAFRLGLDGVDTLAGTVFNDTSIYSGTGTYGNSNTPYFLSKTGRFSLADKLQWNGSTLSVNGSGTFSGSITASSGTIGGFTATTQSLTAKTTGNKYAGIRSSGQYRFFSGASDTNGTGANFKVDTSGTMTASNGTFSGTITSTSGTIGGSTLSSGKITGGEFRTSPYTTTLSAMDGDSIKVGYGVAKFYVASNSEFTAAVEAYIQTTAGVLHVDLDPTGIGTDGTGDYININGYISGNSGVVHTGYIIAQDSTLTAIKPASTRLMNVTSIGGNYNNIKISGDSLVISSPVYSQAYLFSIGKVGLGLDGTLQLINSGGKAATLYYSGITNNAGFSFPDNSTGITHQIAVSNISQIVSFGSATLTDSASSPTISRNIYTSFAEQTGFGSATDKVFTEATHNSTFNDKIITYFVRRAGDKRVKVYWNSTQSISDLNGTACQLYVNGSTTNVSTDGDSNTKRNLSIDVSGLTAGTVYQVKFQMKTITASGDELKANQIVIAVESY